MEHGNVAIKAQTNEHPQRANGQTATPTREAITLQYKFTASHGERTVSFEGFIKRSNGGVWREEIKWGALSGLRGALPPPDTAVIEKTTDWKIKMWRYDSSCYRSTDIKGKSEPSP